MELINEQEQSVARRRVEVVRGRWCFCAWHCLCACVGGVDALQCHPVTTEEYHEAGFQGSLPVTPSSEDGFLRHSLHFLLIFTLLLVLFGKCYNYAVGLIVLSSSEALCQVSEQRRF